MNTRIMSSSQAIQSVIDCNDLPKKSKEKLLLFIKKFPDLEFYRNFESDLSSIEESHGVTIPEIFKQYRYLLAGVGYGKNAKYVFRSENKANQNFDINDKTFDVSFFGNGLNRSKEDESRKTFLYSSKRISLFPIATCEDSPGLYLAINLLGNDKSVYAFNSEDVFDAKYDGEDIFSVVYKVFLDYSDLLNSITKILLEEIGKNVFIEANSIDVHLINKPSIVKQSKIQNNRSTAKPLK